MTVHSSAGLARRAAGDGDRSIRPPALELRNVVKEYPGSPPVRALDDGDTNGEGLEQAPDRVAWAGTSKLLRSACRIRDAVVQRILSSTDERLADSPLLGDAVTDEEAGPATR